MCNMVINFPNYLELTCNWRNLQFCFFYSLFNQKNEHNEITVFNSIERNGLINSAHYRFSTLVIIKRTAFKGELNGEFC